MAIVPDRLLQIATFRNYYVSMITQLWRGEIKLWKTFWLAAKMANLKNGERGWPAR
jgi:hypothetical protein